MAEDLDNIVEDILSKQQEREKKAGEKVVTKGDYPGLTMLIKIYRILMWIVIVAGALIVISGILTLLRGNVWAGIYLILVGLVGGASFALFYMVIAEIIKLFIRIELNTREQVTLLSKLLDKKS
jgi:ABC-type anion transport system duplicated permease subunit